MLVNIDNDWAAYCFDLAVSKFGMALENAMSLAAENAGKKSSMKDAAKMTVFNRWMGIESAAQFRSPIDTVKVKKG